MKNIILSFSFLVIFYYGYSQTNVSGGIFSNTTWTLAGSPYIVVDTTVVFPGVTLTIDPGVMVKFDDHIYLEIRQATLIANGTITDSITFTSNNPAPTPGIWGHNTYGGLWFNGSSTGTSFNFINISYATYGLRNFPNIPYLKNSTFTYNQTGIYSINVPMDSCVFKFNETAINSIGNANYCTISNNYYGVYDLNGAVLNYCAIDSNHLAFGGATGGTYSGNFFNCSISHNQYGLNANGPGGNVLRHCVINFNSVQGLFFGIAANAGDSVIDCEIKYNGLGVGTNSNTVITHCDIEYDTIGIRVNNSAANIYCNKICNNISYGLQMATSANFNADDNYWCTNDSTQIAAAIYDGYDNVSFGLVTFLPTDSTCNVNTGINEMANAENNFSIFPNPTSGIIHFTFNTKHNAPLQCEIMNVMGEKVFQTPLTPKGELTTTQFDVSFLAKGIYVVRVSDGEKWENKKLVVE